MRCFRITLLASLLVFAAVAAQAHRVNVFAWVEGSEVHVETEFSRGNPVKGGTIEVHNTQTDDVLVSGRTNDAGLFVFALPKSVQSDPVDLEIVVIAGQGHMNSWIVRAQDYSDASAVAAQPEETTTPAQPASADAGPPATGTALDPAVMSRLEQRMAQAMEAKLDEKLAPLVRAVNRMEEDSGPSLSDVFGGIGYLIGLAGLAAYFRSRKH